jgi:Fe-S-cluster formation regulator IscX/YfhJ
MTQNKAEFLGDRYRDSDPRYPSYVEIDKFIDSLKNQAHFKNKKIFESQDEIDQYYLEQKNKGLDVKGLGVSEQFLQK